MWDPFSTSTTDDPYCAYRELRKNHPLYRAEEWDVWALSRYEEVQAAARDWESYASTPSVDLDDTAEVIGPGNLIDSDPPPHDQLRDVVRKHFSPRAINEAFESSIKAAVADLLDEFCDQGEADLAADFAWPLPVMMISELLGLPKADRQDLQRWVIAFAEREPGKRPVPESMQRAGRELTAYLGELIGRRRHDLGDDLLSHMIRAERAGSVSAEEVVGLALLLCDAGTQTTAGLIGNALLALEQHPEQRDLLSRDPDLGARAVEELLRFDSPVQYLARRTTRDVEVLGEVIPVDSRVALLWGSANRDESRFTSADHLDLARKPQRHLGFGEGIHFCLGAPLARLEARIALTAFLERIPNYSVAGSIRRQQSHATRGLTELPVTFPSCSS